MEHHNYVWNVLKVNNKDTKTVVNIEQISQKGFKFCLLTLNK